MAVGGAHGAEAGEGRHEHEQRRARQVEVGHQRVDGFEAITGRDEDRRIARPGRNASVVACGAFKNAQRRRADGDDAATACPRFVERGGGFGGDLAPLAVHLVLAGVVGLHGKECARSDVQRHEMARDTARAEGGEKLGREVQPGGRRGNGPVILRVDSLIALAVAIIGAALQGDVRRQRHHADRADRIVENAPRIVERQLDFSCLAFRRNGRVECAEKAAFA